MGETNRLQEATPTAGRWYSDGCESWLCVRVTRSQVELARGKDYPVERSAGLRNFALFFRPTIHPMTAASINDNGIIGSILGTRTKMNSMKTAAAERDPTKKQIGIDPLMFSRASTLASVMSAKAETQISPEIVLWLAIKTGIEALEGTFVQAACGSSRRLTVNCPRLRTR
jgi:hypothetical protein